MEEAEELLNEEALSDLHYMKVNYNGNNELAQAMAGIEKLHSNYYAKKVFASYCFSAVFFHYLFL